MSKAIEHDEVNSVALRGRLAADPELRTMPSGDELCSFRVTVDRPPGSRTRVDSIDCSTVAARVRRTIQSARPGDELVVRGSLHRRFWRSATGLGSRYEVDVRTARVSSRRRTVA
ncbi:MAG: single-stranded DNA-binding protein [Jatrophihabitantaceae bacterium]